jgi:hypothetical protein
MLTAVAVPASRQLTPALAAVQTELGRGGYRSLASCDHRLAARAPAAPGQIACLLRTVPNVRALLKEQRDLNAKVLTTQRGTLSYNRRIYDLFVESLRIQREILQRTRSLDTKTGGPAPGTPASP